MNTYSPYSDIIDLPAPCSLRRERMPMLERAAQFAPFAALTGFDSLIGEEARLTDSKPAVDGETARQINEHIELLLSSPSPAAVNISIFIPDKSKPGGKIVSLTGFVRRVDPVMRTLTFCDKTTVSLDDIMSLDLELPIKSGEPPLPVTPLEQLN